MRIITLSPFVLLAAFATTAIADSSMLGKTMPITAEVRVGANGPYRFLVDTGAQSSLIDTQLAAELGIAPQFRVEVVNVHGSRLVPGSHVRGVTVQGVAVATEVEMLIDDPAPARAQAGAATRGVLGANVLNAFNYSLEPGAGRLIAGAERPEGDALPFTREQGQMVVRGRMGAEQLRFVLDSGSNHVVLFRLPTAMVKTKPVASTVKTLDGATSQAPALWTADILFGEGTRIGMLPAAILSQPGRTVDGLFPTAAFSKLFVDQARSEIVVTPRPR